MAKVVLSRRAYVDLARLRRFLAEKSPIAADKAAEEIRRAFASYQNFRGALPSTRKQGCVNSLFGLGATAM